MDMVYEEWRKKEDRTITSIAEEDENENEDEEKVNDNKLEEIKEETEDLWWYSPPIFMLLLFICFIVRIPLSPTVNVCLALFLTTRFTL